MKCTESKILTVIVDKEAFLDFPDPRASVPCDIQFSFQDEDAKKAVVSFDEGKTWVPLVLVDDAVKAFVEKHPEFAA
jgi:hypothetical protein